MWGRSFYTGLDREEWHIRPLLEGTDRGSLYTLDHDKRLREITSGMQGLIVRFRVPPDARLLDTIAQQIVGAPGDAFLEIERCHLSAGPEPSPWMRRLEVVEDHPMRHDIAAEFRLLGRSKHSSCQSEKSKRTAGTRYAKVSFVVWLHIR